MCGIFGIYFKDSLNLINESMIHEATERMHHRGPDDSGYYISKGIGFGHRRLSIIDLSSGQQPIFNDDQSKCIIFNGEIYNYLEIRRQLLNLGYKFKTNSDTEVILLAYEEYGEQAVELFRGIFAFAIYDLKDHSLFVARDHLGVKPLYYYEDKEIFIFASEIKSLFQTGLVQIDVEKSMIDSYLTIGYTPTPHTLFKNIFKLRPAHYFYFKQGIKKETEYWKVEHVSKFNDNFATCASRLRKLLLESVELQLISEVPLGVFLSGGLDSSTIVGCMNTLGCKDIMTFSVGYSDKFSSDSELDYARLVAKRFKTDHHEYILTPMNFFDSIDKVLEYTEEPLVDRSAIALYQLAKLAKKNATVLLSGEGGDELFAGYPIYFNTKQIEYLRMLISWLPESLQKRLAESMPYSEKRQKYVDWIHTPFDKRYQGISADVTENIRKRMYQPQFLDSVKENNELEVHFKAILSKMVNGTKLSRMLFTDMKTWLIDDLMLKADKMSMASAIELRVPFLDFKLVEFATALPDEFKLKRRQGKYILKKVMEDLLPEEIIYRKKMGFTVPTTLWFRSDLYDKISSLLLSESFLSRGYVRRSYIKDILSRHKSGRNDFQSRIFSLLTLELWHRKYID